jgi:hypothetical protein
MLTLSEALKNGQLREFIAQDEASGGGPASNKKLDARHQGPRH